MTTTKNQVAMQHTYEDYMDLVHYLLNHVDALRYKAEPDGSTNAVLVDCVEYARQRLDDIGAALKGGFSGAC